MHYAIRKPVCINFLKNFLPKTFGNSKKGSNFAIANEKQTAH